MHNCKNQLKEKPPTPPTKSQPKRTQKPTNRRTRKPTKNREKAPFSCIFYNIFVRFFSRLFNRFFLFPPLFFCTCGKLQNPNSQKKSAQNVNNSLTSYPCYDKIMAGGSTSQHAGDTKQAKRQSREATKKAPADSRASRAEPPTGRRLK